MARLNYVAGMTLQQKDANGETNYYLFGETTFSGSNGPHFKIAPNFEVLEMNQTKLKTKIRVYLDFVSLGYAGSGAAVLGYINGVRLQNSYTSISNNQSLYMGCLDLEISHDQTSGQGAINVSCAVNSPWPSLGNAQSTTTIYTNVFPRASSISIPEGIIEENVTISINRASAVFTHNLYYSFGSLQNILIATGIGTSYVWTIPADLYAQIPNSTTGVGTIRCDTYNGNNLIGQNVSPFRVWVTYDRSAPQISMTVVDTNSKSIALTGSSSKLIRFVSNAKVTLGVSGKNSASIKSSSILGGNNQTVNSTSYTFSKIESNYFKGTTTDSRGFSTSVEKRPTMIQYIKLTLNTKVYRPLQTGSEIRVELSGNYFNGNFGVKNNTLSLKFRYKKKKDSSFGGYASLVPAINSDNTYKLNAPLGSNFDYKEAYDFEFVVTDQVESLTIPDQITNAVPIVGEFEKFIELWSVKAIRVDENGTLIINGNIKIDGSNKLLKNL